MSTEPHGLPRERRQGRQRTDPSGVKPREHDPVIGKQFIFLLPLGHSIRGQGLVQPPVQLPAGFFRAVLLPPASIRAVGKDVTVGAPLAVVS